MTSIEKLKIKIFADGANIEDMKEASMQSFIKGFTTNPTLMRKAGVSDYEAFAKAAIAAIPEHPISFEVFSDDFDEMERQADKIFSWGGNTYIKIPITNTKGESAIPLIQKLSQGGLALNVTAIMTLDQIRAVAKALNPEVKSIVSVFAGRIADTGRDPIPLMIEAVSILKWNHNAELLWASPRELLNILQADNCGCHIITVLSDIIKKLNLIGKELDEFSLDTVKMFYKDARLAGYKI